MRVALMIEGQEDVTWEDWVALAQACERNGFEALFRSDHYISVDDFRDPHVRPLPAVVVQVQATARAAPAGSTSTSIPSPANASSPVISRAAGIGSS